MHQNMSLEAAITQFLQEFVIFEGRSVNTVLASLAADATLLEPAQRRLGLDARLTLIKRLAMARADKASLMLLDRVIEKSTGLQQKFHALTRHGFANPRDTSNVAQPTPKIERQRAHRVWMPTLIEINDSIEEAGNLQRLLGTFVGHYRNGATTMMTPVSQDNRAHDSTSSPAAF